MKGRRIDLDGTDDLLDPARTKLLVTQLNQCLIPFLSIPEILFTESKQNKEMLNLQIIMTVLYGAFWPGMLNINYPPDQSGGKKKPPEDRSRGVTK